MHQPDYRDPVTGIARLPWVRLHAAKDYVDMAMTLKEFPGVKVTFNVTPVLIEQLLDLEKSGKEEMMARVRTWLKDAREEDRRYLVENCFMAHRERHIRPVPAYEKLLQKSEEGKKWEALSEQDVRDLIVLFQLSWTDEYWFERNEELRRIRGKGSGFTADEVMTTLRVHMEAVGSVLPEYRRLADAGQAELSTTAYYHPIGPLVLDQKVATESLPGIVLPRESFEGVEDLRWQMDEAVRRFRETFGREPEGMWPAEGGISDQFCVEVGRAGFKWLASDEHVLRGSQVEGGCPGEAAHLTAYYCGDGEMPALLFRDHELSDRIGFEYSEWDAEAAAQDLVEGIVKKGEISPLSEPVVCLALDGENPWENYADDGRAFLMAFYRRIQEDPRIVPVKAGEAARANMGSRARISHIRAGSWIDASFGVWMGHEEDRRAWEALGRARRALLEAGSGVPAPARVRAWRHLMVAEASDWTWWYGDEHPAKQALVFDWLFRQRLVRVYEEIGVEAPVELSRAIKSECQ